MKTTLKSLALVALRIASVVILFAPFALAALLLIYGEIGLAVVILGLGLLQAMVLVLIWSSRGQGARATRRWLWPAE